MGLTGEQILASSGVLAAIRPGPVKATKALLAKADKLPARARAKLVEAIAQEKPGPDKGLPPLDYDEMLAILPVPLVNPDGTPTLEGQRRLEENVAGWPDQTLANEYAGALGTAWGYLQSVFPIETIEHLTGIENVRPPEVAVTRFRRALAVVDDPLSVIDRLASGELLSAEVASLKAAYPAICQLLQSLAIEVLIDETAKRREKDKEWQLPRRKDTVLRRLLETPVGVAQARGSAQAQERYAEQAQSAQQQQTKQTPDGKLPSTDAELTRSQVVETHADAK